MIYHLSFYLKSYLPCLNVIHYVSVRAVASLLSSFGSFLLFGRYFLALSQRYFCSKTRDCTPESHRAKGNKPTMGGIFILAIVVMNSFFWCDLSRPQVWIFLLCILGFGLIGFWDDWNKIYKKTGISACLKFKLQLLVASIVALALFYTPYFSTQLVFPFFKHCTPNLDWLWVPWAIFLLVGCSNAVNLTDGLDG